MHDITLFTSFSESSRATRVSVRNPGEILHEKFRLEVSDCFFQTLIDVNLKKKQNISGFGLVTGSGQNANNPNPYKKQDSL